jgi:uncharacterized protein (TIGR03118 family)
MRYCQRAAASLTVPVGLSLVLALASPASAQQRYERVNLVSDIDGVALRKDPNLVNPWGVAFSPTSPFWISDNGTGVSTLYNGDGQPQPSTTPLVVTIPPPRGSSSDTKATPTGQVFNSSSGFMIMDKDNAGNGNSSGPSRFIFATEDGTISGWNPNVNPTKAILTVDNSSSKAVYKGLAISSNDSRLYAANFSAGTIEMFDSNFAPTPTNRNSFTDPNIPSGFAPFNIRDINGKLYVTYAKQDEDKHDDVAGQGNGFVDVFDEDGKFLYQLASHGTLNSPWGLALAPQNFGQFSGALLVGNFGDGRINAFDPNSGKFLGQLYDQIGQPLAINGLWALVFGNGQQAGAINSLFFTAGIGDEGHGLFGVIRAGEELYGNNVHRDIINY